jgi:hypothetical protein
MTDAREAITEYLNCSIASGGKGWTTQQHADAIIAALAAAGLVIVPKEPTLKMLLKARAGTELTHRGVYRAMVEAATDE